MPPKQRAMSSSRTSTPVDDRWSSGESESKIALSDEEFDIKSNKDDSDHVVDKKWYSDKDFVSSVSPFISGTGLCNVLLTGNSIFYYFLTTLFCK